MITNAPGFSWNGSMSQDSSNVGQLNDMRGRTNLGQKYDPRNNAFNAFRLALAIAVIFWHSYALTGRGVPFAPARRLVADVGVDGFFVISGFLITSSWLRNPRTRDYFVARGLRILPGFYVCLVVTAIVIAPIGTAAQGGSAANLLLSAAPIQYILKNIAVWMFQFDVGGTPHGVPVSGAWDGSLWTLGWELLCYLAVAGVGVLGMLSRRWFLPAAMTLAWSALLLSTVLELPRIAHDGPRFFLLFMAGALMHQGRNVIPARWSLVAASVVAVLAASFLPDYRLIAGVPLAYAVIVSGALIHDKRFRLRTDLSYGVYIYAFPIQQLLIISGLGSINPIAFWVVATVLSLPVAALSWFLIEKPALSRKSRLLRRRPDPPASRRSQQQPVEGQITGGAD
jgi:peptidoglycan/LPS O-acetylase OafA/YrhL